MTRHSILIALLVLLAGTGAAAAQGFQGTPPDRSPGVPPTESKPGARPQSYVEAVGGTKVTLTLPAGFCRLDPGQPSDKRMIDLQEQVQRGQNLVLLFAADCRQLEDWRTGRRPLLDDFLIYLAPATLANRDLGMTPAQFVAEMRKVFERQGAAMMEASADEIKKRIESASSAKVNETRFIGILHTDARSIYVGIIQRLQPETGGTKTQVGVSGIGLLRGKAVSVNVYGNMANGEETPLKVLSRAREVYDATLNANGVR